MELLREHANQILPHPITISVKPGHLVLQKDILPSPLGLWWTSPHLVILMTPTAVKLNGFPNGYSSQETIRKWRRELEDSWNCLGNNISQWLSWPMPILMPMFLALLFFSFLPCITHMSALANQKFNQLYLQGYQPLQNHPEDCYGAPTRTQEPEDPAPYNAPLPAGSS
jgi:hypothetical protein